MPSLHSKRLKLHCNCYTPHIINEILKKPFHNFKQKPYVPENSEIKLSQNIRNSDFHQLWNTFLLSFHQTISNTSNISMYKV